MILFWLAVISLLAAAFSYVVTMRTALISARTHSVSLRSRPVYYGAYGALALLSTLLLVSAVWLALEPRVIYWLLLGDLLSLDSSVSVELLYAQVQNTAAGILPLRDELEPLVRRFESLRSSSNLYFSLSLGALGVLVFGYTQYRITPDFRARIAVERFVVGFLCLAAFVAVFTTAGIVFSLLFESYRFFERVPVHDFLFGMKWSPQIAIREDQVGASGAFGAIPLFSGTFLIAAVAMAIAVPLGLFSAIYLAEYASKAQRAILKPLLEILAGIPTVVYGFFAALTVAPYLKDLGADFGLSVSAESALAAGLVMGVMIIPFMSSLSDDVINAVPQRLRDASLALGSTQAETVVRVILPAALPGIVGAFLLSVSRAIGETMIVVMAAGLAANLTLNPLENVTTVTVQIVTILIGDQEFESAKTLAAFALGLVLFIVTLIFNVIALYIVKRFREKYE